MAAAQALSNPLILDAVFSNFLSIFEIDTDLREFMLVNCLWFKHASEVLWREAPVSYLERIDTSRRQIYASRIRWLKFTAKDTYDHSKIATLELPRLEILSIDDVSSIGTVLLKQYLRPTLRRLHLSSRFFNDFDLFNLRTKLPQLQSLSIGYPLSLAFDLERHDDGANLLRILQGADHVQSIECTGECPITSQIMLHLAGRSNLTEWTCETVLDHNDYIESLQWVSPLQVFRALQYLNISISGHILPILCRYIKSVRKLVLDVVEDEDWDSFGDVAGLSNLEDLNISFTEGSVFCPSFKELKRLAKLQRLCLLEGFDEDEEPTALPNREVPEDLAIQHVLGGLKNLTYLRFNSRAWPATTSSEFLHWISNNMPALERLYLVGPCIGAPPLAFCRKPPGISRLRDLQCWISSPGKDEDTDTAKANILRLLLMFPSLDTFYDNGDWHETTQCAWETRSLWLPYRTSHPPTMSLTARQFQVILASQKQYFERCFS